VKRHLAKWFDRKQAEREFAREMLRLGRAHRDYYKNVIKPAEDKAKEESGGG
jgi:hypothetical protein